MTRKPAEHAARAVDKSTFAATPRARAPIDNAGAAAPNGAAISRRGWLGIALATGGAVASEVASLGGAWDHRSFRAALPPPPEPSALGAARLLHIGHCCHLIELSGQRWLTDPWFFNPAFGSLTHESARPVGSLGPLDGIFISHRHPDHFDPRALAQLDRRAQVWTPDPSLLGPLQELGFARVVLSNPWQTLVHQGLEVSFVPAEHDVPEHSLMLAGSEARVLFCGDTGPHDHWREIRRRYRPTTALLPCDGTALRWEPRRIMNPEEAAHAAFELGCTQVLQTHADATYTDPIARYVLSTTEPEPVARLAALLASAARDAPTREPAAGSPRFTPLISGETRALAAATSTTL